MTAAGAEDRAQAELLFAEGRAADARGDYRRARDCYRQSLALHEDPAARAALQSVLATLGPK